MIGPALSSRGGIVTAINNLSEGLKKCGVTCLYHCIGFDAFFLKKTFLYLLKIPKFLILISSFRVDLVHAHPSERWGFYRYVPYVFLCRLFQVPILFHMHGGSFKQFYDSALTLEKWLIRITLGQIECMICLSEYWKTYFSKLTPVVKYIIPNSVKLFKENQYNVNANGIVFVGFIEKKKGVFDLIEVFSSLTDIQKYSLHICGSGDVDLLEQRIQKLNIEDRVKVHGWVSEEERNEIFKESKLFILPSYFEALPMSLLEAMSFGLPVIVTSVGSIPEVVSDCENGIIVEPGDLVGLCKAIISMLSDNKRLQYISKNNFQKITSSYSIDKNTKKLMTFYNVMVNTNRRDNL